MFTEDKSKGGIKRPVANKPDAIVINPIQETPQRTSIYTINRCEDQAIGFEFTTFDNKPNIKCFGNVLLNFCIPIQIVNPISISSVEFLATDDPCYKDWSMKKNMSPDIDILSNEDLISGVIVRFFENETCCLPTQMSFKLMATDNVGSKFSVAKGLLVFK